MDDLRDTVPAAVLDHIIACDPRYKHHLPDGSFVLVQEDGTEITSDPAAYLEEHDIGTDEVFYATLDTFLSDVRSTNIVPTGDVVNVLLDLRSLFQQYKQSTGTAFKNLLAIVTANGGK